MQLENQQCETAIRAAPLGEISQFGQPLSSLIPLKSKRKIVTNGVSSVISALFLVCPSQHENIMSYQSCSFLWNFCNQYTDNNLSSYFFRISGFFISPV